MTTDSDFDALKDSNKKDRDAVRSALAAMREEMDARQDCCHELTDKQRAMQTAVLDLAIWFAQAWKMARAAAGLMVLVGATVAAVKAVMTGGFPWR